MQDTMRHLIIDQLLVDKKVVTLQQMQTVLQVSLPTLKRDLRYMREILGAPIVYSRQKKGYMYRKECGRKQPEAGGKRLFPERRRHWYSSDELFTLVGMAEKVKTFSQDSRSAMAGEFGALSSRMAALLHFGGIEPEELLARIKIIDSKASHKEPSLFEVIGAALCEHRRLRIVCLMESISEKRLCTDISPVRMVHYGSRWYADVFCHEYREFRSLPLENIFQAEILAQPGYSGDISDIESELDAFYGEDRNVSSKTACILFDETVAPFIELEEWHPCQKICFCGSRVKLTVPYRKETEIIGNLLRWGNHAEVKEPEELRQKVCKVLEDILSLYRSDRVQ